MSGADEAEQKPPAAVRTPPAPGLTAQTSEQPTGTIEQAAEQKPLAPGTDAERTSATSEQDAERTSPASEEDAKQTSPTLEQDAERTSQAPGFGERGRMRRRARFLRKARELAYRDLGGLVFDLHRFGQRNDQLVLAKLATLRQIDTELRELEAVLRERRPVTVLREVGIAACPRCAAIHGSDDRFCPGCGLAFDTNADRPISTAPVSPQAQTPAPVAQPTAAHPSAAHPSAAHPSAAHPSAPHPSTADPSAAHPSAAQSLTETSPATTSPPPSSAPVTASAPPLKPTAPPVAAKPFSPPAAKPTAPPAMPKHAPAAPAAERHRQEPIDEDEPTRILRPPNGDTGA